MVHTEAHGGFWSLFTYADIGHVARSTEEFSSHGGATIPSHGFPMQLPPIEADPPHHAQYRVPMLPLFAPSAIEKLIDPMRSMVTELINGFCERGSADLAFDRFPNRHVVFGAGPHRCLGLHLARVQLRIIIEEVLRRLPDYEVQTGDVERYIGVTRGIGSLPITFTPSKPM